LELDETSYSPKSNSKPKTKNQSKKLTNNHSAFLIDVEITDEKTSVEQQRLQQ
jgi:hypothetical protein